MLTKCINRNKIYIFAHTYMHHNSLCFMNIVSQYSWLLDKRLHSYTGWPPNKEWWIFSTKKVACFGVIAYNIFFWKNDTRIIELGWAVLILWPFLETWSFVNFAQFEQAKGQKIQSLWWQAIPWPIVGHWFVQTKQRCIACMALIFIKSLSICICNTIC